MSSSNLKVKNVIFKNYKITHDLVPGLEKTNRRGPNNENLVSLVGTRAQINSYLQKNANEIASERLRTLNSIPKMRQIGTTKVRIY
jgi:hypothetical protein